MDVHHPSKAPMDVHHPSKLSGALVVLAFVVALCLIVEGAYAGITTCPATYCSSHGLGKIANNKCVCTCDAGYTGVSCDRCAYGYTVGHGPFNPLHPRCDPCETYDPYRGDVMSNPLPPPNTNVSATLTNGIVAVTVTWGKLPVPAATPALVLMREPRETGLLSAITNVTPTTFWADGAYVGNPNSCNLVATASIPLSSCELCTTVSTLTFRCYAHYGALARLPGELSAYYKASWSAKEFHYTYPVMVDSRDGNRLQVATVYCGTSPDSVSCLLYVAANVSLAAPTVIGPSWVGSCVLRRDEGANFTNVDCVATPWQLPLTANFSVSISMSSTTGSIGSGTSTSVALLEHTINMPLPPQKETIVNSGLAVVGGGSPDGTVVHLGNGNDYELVLASTLGVSVAPEVLAVSLQASDGGEHVVAAECWWATSDAIRTVVTVTWDVGCSLKRNESLVNVAWTVVVTTRLYARATNENNHAAARARHVLGLDQRTISVMVGSVVVDDGTTANGHEGIPPLAWAAGGVAAVALMVFGVVAWQRRQKRKGVVPTQRAMELDSTAKPCDHGASNAVGVVCLNSEQGIEETSYVSCPLDSYKKRAGGVCVPVH